MSAELVQCLILESCRAVSLHRLIYQACVKTQAHTPAHGTWCYYSPLCYTAAESERGQWVFALPLLTALTCSAICGSLNWLKGAGAVPAHKPQPSHTPCSPFNANGGGGGTESGMFISASLLLHFKWINDKSPPSLVRVTVFSFHSRSSFWSTTASWPCSSHLWFTVTLLLPSGDPLCLHASACFQHISIAGWILSGC